MPERSEAVNHRYYETVYRYVRRRTRSREDAEDLTQGVFAEAVSSLQQTAEVSGPTLAWLYTVAQRRLIDEHRRRNGSAAQVVSLDAVRLEQRSEENYGVDLTQVIAEAIAALPADQQQVVVLKLIEGRRFAEIAVTLSLSEEACRARLSRALRALRGQLEAKGIVP